MMEFDGSTVVIKCVQTPLLTMGWRLLKKFIRDKLIWSRKVATPSKNGANPSRLLVHNSESTSSAEGGHFGEERSVVDRKPPEICPIRDDDSDTKIERGLLVDARNEIDRICQQYVMRDNNEEDAKMAIRILEQAMNLLQSDFIANSRCRLRDVFELVSKLDSRSFKTPSGHDLQVLERGEELFWTWGGEKGVSCSVKHGIIILDPGNAHFYARLINVVGAFATETSEFQIAEKAFSILIELHEQSDSTSRLRGMGASFNNRGCILLITGEYKQASSDFQNSLRHLNCCKKKQFCLSGIDSMMTAVESNACRLDMSCRYFSKAVTQQKRLVEKCKAKDNELPFQTAFTVLLNQANLYTTLAMFAKAEKELKFLKTLCKKVKRDECDLLLNFVHLQLCEVLLLRAKHDEAERAFPFEALTSASVQELMPLFQGLHLNVRIESFEKMIDVLIQIGKIKFARELLEKGLKIVKKVFGFDHFDVASLLYKQGTILTLMGELASALKKFEDAKEIWRLIFGEKHQLLINCYTSLGDIAFRLDPADESRLYFQRAMENVEIIHQVSLPDQLFMRYLALTRSTKDNSHSEYQRREIQEEIVEGLVAEYGLALAVLVRQLGVKDIHASRKKKQKGKQPQFGKVVRVRHLESTFVISQKCMRDLLQSGKTFLQHGMTKEALAFFKQAGRYGMTNNIACPNAALVHLCTIISQAKLTIKNKLETPALSSYLEDVKAEAAANANEESIEGHSEEEEKLTFDNQMSLKLLLIFFLLLSIHLQAHDTTFAAYDFYASQFPNDDRCFLTLDGALQVYASRTSVTCNGKTAVQDVFVSSAIFENKSDWEGHLSGKPLFRSLACRSNKPSCNLIASLSSPFFMDVDDVKKLEQKVLHSFQEFFQLKSLGFESNATQAVVDLTCCCEQDIMTCGSRIELLPLCLLEQVSQSKILNECRIISEMNPGLCERITCMNFTDKQTTCAMFSKISLWFLKNCTWEETSALRPQDECLVLTVLDPVRARVTLWQKDISIMQKVQVIRITDSTTQLDEISRELNFREDFGSSSSPCCKAIEQFAIERFSETLTNTHGVRSKGSVVRRQCAFSDEPQYANDNCLKAAVPPSEEFRQKGECSPVYSEENEAERTEIQVSTLEILTEFSRLSRQLSEKEIQPEDDIVTDTTLSALDGMASPPDEEPMSYPKVCLTSNGGSEEIISGNFELTTCSFKHDSERDDLARLERDHSVSTEADQLSLEKKQTETRAKEDSVFLGRTLFEEDMKSRRSFITDFQERLRKKDSWQEMKSNVLDVSAFSQTANQVFSAPHFLISEDNSKDWMQPKSRSAFYGGDAVADGCTPGVPFQQSEHAANPALKAVCSYQSNVKKEKIILEGGRASEGSGGSKNIDEQKHVRNHCPNNFGNPDVIDGSVEQTSSNVTNVSHSSPNFGGARPKQGFFVAGKDYSASAGRVDLTSAYPPGKIGYGLDPKFVERHAVINSLQTSKLYNVATWDDPRETHIREHYFSARTFGNVNSMPRLTAYGPPNSHLSNNSCQNSFKKDVFTGSSTIESSVYTRTLSQAPLPEQDESWHFPSLLVNSEHCVQTGYFPARDSGECAKYLNQGTLQQDCEPLFDNLMFRSSYQEMRSLADEFMIEQGSQGEAPGYSDSYTEGGSAGVNKLKPNSNQGSQESLLECLRMVMSTTVNLFASINASEEQVRKDKDKDQHTEKLSIQEEAVGHNCDRTGTDGEAYLEERAASLPRNERATDTEEEDHTSPVQESPRPACGHYQRRCLVRFPCCGRFYPCHRCHNESAACTDDQARAINATHIRCTICYHEQVIDEGSQKCRGCNLKLADYFCAICKHFTSLDKNPFHCDKCGICRIHRDKSFHCNVCNVCLDKRLQGKHKCRPDSGHDECCICLEDAFSGCQILPCSHKVHKDCAIAMIQNGIRTCPICRHPLFQQSEGSEQ